MSPDPRKDSTAGIADRRDSAAGSAARRDSMAGSATRRDSMAGSAARRSPAYKAACCGALCALALVIMLAGSLIWVGVYAAPLLAVWVLLPIQNLFGNKAALTAFFAAAVISLLILPDREMALFFCCFGWWPAAKTHVDRLRPAAARVAVKVLIYLAVAVLMYGVLLEVLGIPRDGGSGSFFSPIPGMPFGFSAADLVFLAVGIPVFLLADATLSRISSALTARLRRLLRR